MCPTSNVTGVQDRPSHCRSRGLASPGRPSDGAMTVPVKKTPCQLTTPTETTFTCRQGKPAGDWTESERTVSKLSG